MTVTFSKFFIFICSFLQSYNTLRGQIADESMIVWAGQIRDLAAGADIQNESLIQAQEDIQAFIDGIETADYDGTVALTEQLIDGVNNVTFKLYCLTAKFAALKYAVSECAEGSGNISTLFEETQSLAVANSGGCVDSGYIQYENFTTYVDLEMLEQGKTPTDLNYIGILDDTNARVIIIIFLKVILC